MSKMSDESSHDLIYEIKKRITKQIQVSAVSVSGSGGHYRIKVVSEEFRGKSMLDQQRLVYAAIGDLMAGASAPIHAIDHMETLVSE